jgi:hypothetical protein
MTDVELAEPAPSSKDVHEKCSRKNEQNVSLYGFLQYVPVSFKYAELYEFFITYIL